MILYEASTICTKIRSVLAPKNGRRYAIVAFIGQDALDFVPEPRGLIVYCWPNVTATNPDGVKALINEGAKVYFVDRLHMKLYWSESGGAVIGSCNLTQNALGDGATSLREMAYFTSDPSQVRIDEVLSALKPLRREVTPDELAKYRKQYSLAAARRDEWKSGKRSKKGKNKKPTPPPTFAEYMRQPLKGDQGILATCWHGYEKKTPGAVKEAVREAEERAQSQDPDKFIYDYIPCEGKPKLGDWVLGCKIGVNGDYGRLCWVFTHVVARRRKNSDVWVSIELSKRTVEKPPFDCSDKRFVAAFKKYAEEVNLYENDTIRLTAPRLRRLAEIEKLL